MLHRLQSPDACSPGMQVVNHVPLPIMEHRNIDEPVVGIGLTHVGPRFDEHLEHIHPFGLIEAVDLSGVKQGGPWWGSTAQQNLSDLRPPPSHGH